MTSMLP
jgi:hypothetical protein